jgi:hypothetical protein
MIWWPWLILAFVAGVCVAMALILALFSDWMIDVTGFEEDLDRR